jgi:hypothetical protein
MFLSIARFHGKSNRICPPGERSLSVIHSAVHANRRRRRLARAWPPLLFGTMIISSTRTSQSSTAQSSISRTEPFRLKFLAVARFPGNYPSLNAIAKRILECGDFPVPRTSNKSVAVFEGRRKLAGWFELPRLPHANRGPLLIEVPLRSDTRSLPT